MSPASGRNNFPAGSAATISNSATGCSISRAGSPTSCPWVALLPFARFALLENERRAKTLPRLVVRRGASLPRRQPDAGRAPALHHAVARARHLAARHFHSRTRARLAEAVAQGDHLDGRDRHARDALLFPRARFRSWNDARKSARSRPNSSVAIPPHETLYAVDPDYQPYLFYLRRPIVYASEVDDLPPTARYILVQPRTRRKRAIDPLGAGKGGADPADQGLPGPARHPPAGGGHRRASRLTSGANRIR